MPTLSTSKMSRLVWTAAVIFNLKVIVSVRAKIECGYKQCPPSRDGALNVHLIPHSHMDAGWVKTFDEYYYGTKTTVSTANVQLIYHSVLSELLHDKRRKFTFSETAYFWRWWKEQRPATRATFRTLVQEGRVEFAGGGWVHNDEATADYLLIIDQYTWGLRKLNDTLGPCGKPKAAWQIDAYGHSREQASLLAQMGYDGLFIGRVDHKEREAMIEEDRMEYMWRGSDVLGKMSDIMTHALFNLYNAPEGFCFDFLCNDEPIVDDPDNRVYNADKRVNEFVSHVERQAKYYAHDNIAVAMGGDFTYQSAANWFMNMDKLINHVATHPANMSDINIFYSTPSCYLKAIYLFGKRDKALYTDRGDHFPYGSDATTYWTGFYSSRPSLKYLVRRAHGFLQVVKQLTVIARMSDSFELHLLRHAVSLVLHHDAITGTSQQHVTDDFVRILSEAIAACTKKVSSLLGSLTPTWGGSRRSKSTQQFVVCHQLNMSQCRFTESQQSYLVLVYNPLSTKTYHYVRLPSVALHYSIRDYNDEEVEYQLVPLPPGVINLPGRSTAAIQELCFEAENVPPLGYSAFYVTPVRDQLEENEYIKKVQASTQQPDQELVPFISNEYLKVTVDQSTGLLESIQHVDGIKILVSQNYHYYSQMQQAQQSGAYSFRPEKNRPVAVTEKATYSVVRGSLVKEIRQRFSDWVTQVIRLYRGEEFVELDWLVGPVPIGTDLGKEVVSIFKTNISNSGEFSTDSNARQMLRRTCWNDTSNQQQKKPVAACYFPVTSRICIRSLNTSVEMCVLTDRAQGGTAYNEGEIELMVHRRLLTDDGFGLEETLNEEAYGVGLVVRGQHRIYFGNFRQDVEEQSLSERVAAASRRWRHEPWLFLTTGDKLNRRKWQNVRNKRFSALRLHGLPRHISVLTLEPWKAGAVLLRLENTLEKPAKGRYARDKGDGPEELSKPAHITVELRKVFLQMQILMVRETTLAANQWLEDARQMDWSTRYVYTGGDDGLMPEDNIEEADYDKAKTTDNKDSAHYSEEDQDYQRRKPLRPKYSEKVRGRVKSPYEEYDRRKRSLNSTESTLNDTNNDWGIANGTTEEPREDIAFESTTLAVRDRDTIHTTAGEIRTATKRTPKLSFLSKAKPAKLVLEWPPEGEAQSSEEDFSLNLKKRSAKKKKRIGRPSKPETADDADDGVTRSMYEMYYMRRPRVPSRPTRSDEDDRLRHQEARRVKGSYEHSTRRALEGRQRRRGKGMRLDMPFFITDSERKYKQMVEDSTEDVRAKENREYRPRAVGAAGRRKKPKDEYSQDYGHAEDDAEDYNEGPAEGGRRKRTPPQEALEAAEALEAVEAPEYVITLRPTQIRTFVVWFDTNKKTYVI